MAKRKLKTLLVCALVLTALVGCGASSETGMSTTEPVAIDQGAQAAAAGPSETEQETPVTVAEPSAVAGLSESVTDNIEDHAEAEAEVLQNSGSIPIVLNGDSIAVDGQGTTVTGSSVTTTSPGTYSLSGSLADGQVIVDVEDGIVGLVLNGVDISSSTGPAIYFLNSPQRSGDV